jgi:hypothetical protein
MKIFSKKFLISFVLVSLVAVGAVQLLKWPVKALKKEQVTLAKITNASLRAKAEAAVMEGKISSDKKNIALAWFNISDIADAGIRDQAMAEFMAAATLKAKGDVAFAWCSVSKIVVADIRDKVLAAVKAAKTAKEKRDIAEDYYWARITDTDLRAKAEDDVKVVIIAHEKRQVGRARCQKLLMRAYAIRL